PAAAEPAAEPATGSSDTGSSNTSFFTPGATADETATDGSSEASSSEASVPTPTVDESDLNSIKQQALEHLSPLVKHLELSPEEKFRTTMMMLQATDNPGLIKEVFEAALAITDEKTRAQALLDVVNEINYFNQQKS